MLSLLLAVAAQPVTVPPQPALTEAIANVLAERPVDALNILNNATFSDEVDAVMWRTIARAEDHDFVGARTDALASQSVVDAYPVWVQHRFLFSAIRAALETADVPLAQRYLEEIAFATTVADLGAVAIENAKLHEALKTRLEALKEDSDGWYRFLAFS